MRFEEGEDQRVADPTLTELCIKALQLCRREEQQGRAGESGKGELDAERERQRERRGEAEKQSREEIMELIKLCSRDEQLQG